MSTQSVEKKESILFYVYFIKLYSVAMMITQNI